MKSESYSAMNLLIIPSTNFIYPTFLPHQKHEVIPLKYIIPIIILLFALSACQTADYGSADHIGCQEGEIDKDGNCLPAEESNADLFGQDLDMYVDSQAVTDGASGFLAKPKEPGDYPGIIMIHEWWGLNDNIKEMAKLLAKEGYIVFAVDLYGGEVASDSDRARELVTSVRDNPQKAVQDMKNAVKYLKEQQNVKKIASMGWCFGGGQSLQLSLNEDLDATVIYYGQLSNDTEQLKNINWPVLGIFGSEDTSITPDSVRGFDSALDELGIENQIHIYPSVGHAFANPSGSNYAKEETIDAWEKTVAFLNENLKPAKTFNLTGVPFKFIMDGIESPELRVNYGDRVRINFISTEGFHNWVVDEFNAMTQNISAGNSTYVEFIAGKRGTFEYYCSIGMHRQNGMFGKLVVE